MYEIAQIFTGISYGGGRGNPARGSESEWAGLILFYQVCSLRHFINWSSPLSAALRFFFFLFSSRKGIVCKSLKIVASNHTCATTRRPNIKKVFCFHQPRWRKTVTAEKSTQAYLNFSSIQPKYTHTHTQTDQSSESGTLFANVVLPKHKYTCADSMLAKEKKKRWVLDICFAYPSSQSLPAVCAGV